MTNVNPGNNGPRGGSSRIPNDREADRYEDRHIDDRYDNTSDGSFDEAYEEYYDAPADPAPRGKHRRVEDSPAAGAGAASAAAAHPGADAYADTEYIDADYATEYDAEYADGQYATDYAVADDAEYADDRYADHSDPADYDEYDEYDEYADDDRTAVVPAAAGAGAAAEGSSAVAAGGVPKRGLAMILIAVAVLLGLWGIYAMMQNDSSDKAAEQNQNQGQNQGQNPQDPNNPNAQNPGQNPQDPNNLNAQNPGQNPANPQDPNNPNAQNQGQNPQDQNRAPDAAPAGNGQPMTQENETINVYNNSTVPNLAADVSDQLKGQGTKIGEVGNITEAQAILEQNTVFFDPATPGAEERARVLADRVGGVAKANDPTVPREAAKPGSLTLVLTGPVAL